MGVREACIIECGEKRLQEGRKMEMMKAKGSKAIVWTTALCAFGLVVGLSACAPNADKAGRADQKATDKPVAQQVEQTPDADKYGVVHADQWAGDYPYQYQTYKQNDANGTEGKHDYLQLYPALNTMYKGHCSAYSLVSYIRTDRKRSL